MKYVCLDCGKIVDEDEIDTWSEYRGEFWGVPAYEPVSGCPYCHGELDDYDEDDYEDEEDEDE